MGNSSRYLFATRRTRYKSFLQGLKPSLCDVVTWGLKPRPPKGKSRSPLRKAGATRTNSTARCRTKKPARLGAGTAVLCPYKGGREDASDGVAGEGAGSGSGSGSGVGDSGSGDV